MYEIWPMSNRSFEAPGGPANCTIYYIRLEARNREPPLGHLRKLFSAPKSAMQPRPLVRQSGLRETLTDPFDILLPEGLSAEMFSE